MTKKVLLIIPYAEGTIGRCSYNLYLALKKQIGVDVRVFLLSKSKSDLFTFENVYFAPYPRFFGGRIVQIINRILLLRKLKREWQPDVSIGTFNDCSVYNILSGGSEAKVGVFHGEFSWDTLTSKSVWVFLKGRFYYRFLFPFLDWRIAVSEQILKYVEGDYVKSNRGNSCVIYNVHDADFIRRKSKEPIPQIHLEVFKRDVVLVVGALTRNKGGERMARAFALLKHECPNARLIFLGRDYGEKKYILDAITSLGLHDSVVFIDYTENPYPYIARARVLVSASYSEGLPGVLCESLILNTPVVTTNSSLGVWEILDERVNYKLDLKGFVEADKGIITQNLSRLNKEEAEGDELYLAEAVKRYLKDDDFYTETKFRRSSFVVKVLPDFVAKQYLTLK